MSPLRTEKFGWKFVLLVGSSGDPSLQGLMTSTLVRVYLALAGDEDMAKTCPSRRRRRCLSLLVITNHRYGQRGFV